MTLELRDARLDDVAGIMAVQQAAGRATTDSGRLATAIDDERRLVVVALLDDQIVGWAKTHVWELPSGGAPAGHYLGGITVAPDSRRLGIGAALTDIRVRWIWDRADAAYYFTNADNAASIALHRRWGFREIVRAAQLRGTGFSGGVGILFAATPERGP